MGLRRDTGVSLENGVEVKAAGFGVSLGKKMGISTPFFARSVKKKNRVIFNVFN